ncbi:helix-turn-helix domain-containing protein [Vulcanisaeta distributa]|nr:helix-turn-helix domain-containing protein [Vulcanisaeta distributa]
MVEYERDLKKILIWLLGGSRGGLMRLKILLLLKKRPMNPNQLARVLNVNYRTVIYHLELLERYGLVNKLDIGYGAPYFISDKLEKRWDLIRDVMRILGINEREEMEEGGEP